MSDQKARDAMISVMSEILKANPSCEAPYLDLFVVKNDILALIREDEDKAAKEAAEEGP